MPTVRIAILGGGLSGLHAAATLEKRGISDYVVLEARETFGGRIISVPDPASPHWSKAGEAPIAGRFDLGATWFWPTLQPELQQLVDRFGLGTVRQQERGDMLVERSATRSPDRVDGFLSTPPALRLAGGMAALIDALRGLLPADRLAPGRRARRLRQRGEQIEIETEDTSGRVVSYRAAQVLLAVPPRLAVNTIDFVPSLPDALVQQWNACGTWMAPHAKYVAVFESPFWREQGLSGEARSSVGPMVEIHDASAEGGSAALFGFLGVPVRQRHQTPEAVMLALCRAQFARLFGDPAASPRAEFLKDWARDPWTAVAAHDNAEGHHPMRLPAMPADGPWRNRIIGIASEWSSGFPGYVAGAVEAARHGVEALLTPDTTSLISH
ncbi:MAG TPA: FAD-dependent oxidoreductase [Burkholderiaceae bacterium]|nr:FAD-dependent oxidoreductase [Burkholderiaceae bacterium]